MKNEPANTSGGTNPISMLRSTVRAIEPYVPILPFEVLADSLGRPIDEIIKLDANENLYGPSPLVRDALADLDFPHIYPDPENRALRNALSDFTGVPSENIFAGAGADEIIDLIMRLFIDQGDNIIDCPPTFGMYSFDAAVNGAETIVIERKDDFTLDLEAIVEAVSVHSPKLLFLTSPNNPDGGLVSDKELCTLLALPIIVILDEAYIEFAGIEKSRLDWVLKHANLIVMRTFSKWAGLAGLRVGYGAFSVDLLKELWKIKQPYNVSVAATEAALVSLADSSNLLQVVSEIRSERNRLSQMLSRLPFVFPYPSHGNFVLCQVKGISASGLHQDLSAEGILVRYFDKPRLRDHVRISVGLPQHTDILATVLSRIFNK
jgi:histidinol-phosphate aminotransferase